MNPEPVGEQSGWEIAGGFRYRSGKKVAQVVTDTVEGAYNLVTSPIESAKNIAGNVQVLVEDTVELRNKLYHGFDGTVVSIVEQYQ
ncbi:hypothetical protein [Brevibacillus daliensis]|uniref:hypothetical protein n=1 Tax=Brevibacillus daliensis TaxID=2892995 RepID=UPI001E4E3948|nr:hypothetical protein [Brevibacillus daliensis]